MDFVPEIGTHLTQLTLPITRSLSSENQAILAETYSFSDSIHLYLQTALLGILSLGIVWVFVRAKKANSYLYWIRATIAFLLAFFLIKYGIEKWTQLQFPQPPPNILHAELGSLDKDIVFWSLMGTSKVYGGFMGFVEILTGVLLLIPKTRFIGGYFAIGIFLNILALNIGFDISVKLLSLALLGAGIYIAAPSILPLIRLLALKQTAPIPQNEIAINPILKRALKGFAVTLLLLECGLPLFNQENFDFNPETIDQQTFEIVQSGKNPDGIPKEKYHRIHLHSSGFLITETTDGKFESHEIRLPKGANSFTLTKSSATIHASKQGNDWIFSSGKQLIWRCRRVANEDLPLLQDDFHLTVEGMIPE